MNLRALLMIVAVLMTLSACRQNAPLPAVPGNPAPTFALTSPDGSPVRLADHAGRIVVIDFWATWCGPCKEATKDLEEIHRKFRDRGVVVIGISLDTGDDAAAKVREYATRQGLGYRMALDNGKVKTAYGVVRIPATFVLDRKHVIRETWPGFRPGIGKEIENEIERLL